MVETSFSISAEVIRSQRQLCGSNLARLSRYARIEAGLTRLDGLHGWEICRLSCGLLDTCMVMILAWNMLCRIANMGISQNFEKSATARLENGY
jgi:hypothetical protein